MFATRATRMRNDARSTIIRCIHLFTSNQQAPSGGRSRGREVMRRHQADAEGTDSVPRRAGTSPPQRIPTATPDGPTDLARAGCGRALRSPCSAYGGRTAATAWRGRGLFTLTPSSILVLAPPLGIRIGPALYLYLYRYQYIYMCVCVYLYAY